MQQSLPQIATLSLISRKIFALLLTALMLIMPIVLVPRTTSTNPTVDSKEMALRITLALLALSGMLAWRSVRRREGTTILCVGALAWFAINLLSAFASGKAFYCFFETWYLWVLPLLAWVITAFRITRPELEKLAIAIAAAAVICCLYAFTVYFGSDPLRTFYPFYYGTNESRNFVHSFLGNPEYFGSYLAPIATLAFSRFFRPRCRMRTRVMWVVTMVIVLLGLLLSGTRGAIFGFLVTSFIIIFCQIPHFSARGRKVMSALLVFAVLGLGALLTVFSTPNPLNVRNSNIAGRFISLFDLTSDSVRERIFFFSLSGEMIRQNPVLGSGPGTFRLEFYRAVARLEDRDERSGVRLMAEALQNRVAEHAHNDYLEFWTDTGTLGIAALFFLFSLGAWRFISWPNRRPLEHDTSGELEKISSLRLGFFTSALCLFINAAFSFPLHLPVRASLAWVSAGGFFAADLLLRELARQSGAPSEAPSNETTNSE